MTSVTYLEKNNVVNGVFGEAHLKDRSMIEAIRHVAYRNHCLGAGDWGCHCLKRLREAYDDFSSTPTPRARAVFGRRLAVANQWIDRLTRDSQ